MLNKFLMLTSVFLILFVHFTLFASTERRIEKVVVNEPQMVQKISLQKVILKKPEIKKVEQKKEVKKIVKQKVLKKVAKKAEKKVLKKEIKKKETIEKVVEKTTTKTQPQVTKKIVKPKKVEKMVSVEELNVIKNKYLNKLRNLIEDKKIYPNSAKRLKQQGRVIVSFLITKEGTFKNISLKDSSKYKKLNKAALELLNNISKFEPIPDELGKNKWVIEIPINYKILRA
ncbi:energy transducer TonB [Arcobacter arenosus]|uniref:Energy transducer TonB n=2 Tax=Arcobacter arenosus TaxID=2576037 RepID=A0A5R8Y273_9BACT|nr:energy transducer TonB [Arcobacter arenosus]